MEGLKIAVLGLAFKPHTDDMREAPSITLIRGLLNCGAAVYAYDPVAMTSENKNWLSSDVNYGEGIEEILKDADCAVLVTEWPEFKEINWGKNAPLMKNKILFDGRNIYDPQTMEDLGFEYYCIGRSNRPTKLK